MRPRPSRASTIPFARRGPAGVSGRVRGFAPGVIRARQRSVYQGTKPKHMHLRTPILSLAIAALVPACIDFDAEADSGGTGGEIEYAGLTASLETLAANCSFPSLYFAATEAAGPLDQPPEWEKYQVTDACLAQVEQTLLDQGITLALNGPIETDSVRRGVLLGIHSMVFSPMFTPPVPAGGTLPSVYAIDTAQYPYPANTMSLVSEVPPSYAFVMPEGYYNVELAHLFFSTVTGIVDATNHDPGSTARYEQGVISLLGQFDRRYTRNPERTAALLAHELSHEFTYGHKACNVPSQSCGGEPSHPGDDCDCDYELSAYWVEAAFAEAAALGRVISFAPGATRPIDGGTDVAGYFPASRCQEAVKHVTPFRESMPDCDAVNVSLVDAIEAASSYWNAFGG